MQCRYAEFEELDDLVAQRITVPPSWPNGAERVVLFENGSGATVGHAIYRVKGDRIDLVEITASGDLAEAFGVLRDEMWPAKAHVTIEVSADDGNALRLWRGLGFRDSRIVLEAPASPAGPTGNSTEG